MIELNNKVLEQIQSSICLSMASAQQKIIIEPKKVYEFDISPCGAVFFEIHVAGKPSPICLRMIKDVTELKLLPLFDGEDVAFYASMQN